MPMLGLDIQCSTECVSGRAAGDPAAAAVGAVEATMEQRSRHINQNKIAKKYLQ